MINIDEIKNTIKQAKELHKLHTENAKLLDEYEKAKEIIKYYNSENTGEKKPQPAPPKNSAEISVEQIAESLKTNNANATAETEISTDEIYKKLGIK